ncbi:phosphoethanolamine--lipid A transferase [Parahaliea maris]|uniref:Phosphoethanolamine--lipid A transferase n=1 Tax=Parahaliea maris TaxID=2716870 RepID=A0A5C9A9N4_9GAMM|nr:phosphoethanolamine--lipid A transferase [Parahaliea maris]TXS95981.1 phosphoethanolamine--lipid A transferase [Parahaliea maris]
MKIYLPRTTVGIAPLILTVSAYFTLALNWAFFRNSYAVFGHEPGGLVFLVSLGSLLFAVTVLLLSLVCVRYLTKPVLVAFLLVAACGNYFMYRYNIIVDTTMLSNIRETDGVEVSDLLTPALLLQVILLGVLPAALVLSARISYPSFAREHWQRVKLACFSILLALASIEPFTAYYSSFFREHKALRYYTNPLTPVYSVSRVVGGWLASDGDHTLQIVGKDAHLPETDQDRELVILVVGEALRSDHFGLNGYSRNTTPYLEREAVFSFPRAFSCGTATAYSVPCMFSLAGRSSFDIDEAKDQENLLDVLRHAGVNVLWRDNNSDSKGVATRVAFQNFRSDANNPTCDTECRDVGMLSGLDDFIVEHPEGDVVIVLHQMGNHGPAYFKRFPEEFAVFEPYCHSNRLETCSDQEIVNAYDNAVRYTDYFLGKAIEFLKGYDDRFETALLYVSDHGESLGERGIYLHGLPYYLAPDSQRHIASALWLGNRFEADRDIVKANTSREVSHDNYFHTVLGLLEIQTAVYQPELDLLRPLGMQ